ncbi:MAG: hypothetical protein HY537_04615 [Deltaproteobacteria bacterium]|nr:hypothetical protein [Deltaproteobacteria bacterium]
MLPCKEIARLLSSEEELSWMKRGELKMHLLMCKHCSAYAAQLRIIKEAVVKLIQRKETVKVKHLEDDIIGKYSH